MFGRKKRERQQALQARQPRYNGSSKVFSYHANRSIEYAHDARSRLDDDRHNDVSHSSRLAQLPLIAAILVVLFCVGYNLLLSTTPRIIVEGEEVNLVEDQNYYQQSVAGILDNSFANRTKATFSPAAVSTEVAEIHPELRNVRVAIPLLGQRPIVYIAPAEPFAVLRTLSGADYVVSQDGRVMGISSRAETSQSGLIVISDRSGLDFDLGQQAFSRPNSTAIQDVITQLTSKKIIVANVELPPNSQSFHLRLADQPYFVKFTFNEDPRLQAGAFIAASQRFKRDNIIPKEYVDVRVGDKVYFK